MPALSDYTAGTITLTNGSTAFTGSGTGWQAADFREGDTILGIEANGGDQYVVEAITGNAAGTLTQPWEGASGTYTYRMRYLADGARVTAQARELIELLGNGNLQALAGLTGPGVPVFNGPHAMVIRPETDFINGVAYDVQVDTLADRAAYDGQTAGFAVLVSNVGDARSALYTKVTNASGDWSDPAYITGPVGPTVTIEAGTTTTLPPGSDATFDVVPVTGGYELNAGIPAGEGFYWAGTYDLGSAYTQDDVVRHNNSSFIAVQAVPVGTSPSSAVPPVDTAFWAVLAAKGMDGTGTGDVVGPSGAVADRIAVFSGTTGKLIKDGGKTLAEVVPANNSVTNAILADMAVNTIKGRVTAGTGDPEDLTAAQVLTLLKTAGAYAKDNILGTVSQTAGVPTGAILERGSNANGQYVRYADGTQICWHISASPSLTPAPVGNIFQGSDLAGFTFAAPFSVAPRVSPADVFKLSGADAGTYRGWMHLSEVSATGVALLALGMYATSGIFPGYVATGRWF